MTANDRSFLPAALGATPGFHASDLPPGEVNAGFLGGDESLGDEGEI